MSERVITSFRLPRDLLSELDAHREKTKETRTEVTTQALRRHLDTLRDDHVATDRLRERA